MQQISKANPLQSSVRGLSVAFITLSSMIFLGCNSVLGPGKSDPRFYPIGAGSGTTTEVFAVKLDAYRELMYVGGKFDSMDQSSSPNVALLYEDDDWRDIEGLNGEVYAFEIVGSYMYAGGKFTQSENGTTGLNCIARRHLSDGTNWEALADNGLTLVATGATCEVRALAADGTNLFVGGSFSRSAQGTMTTVNNVARYDTTGTGSWHSLAENGLNGTVRALKASGGEMFVGGDFIATFGGTSLKHIARYNTTPNPWSAVTHGGQGDGLNATVRAFELSPDNTKLYVGGDFTDASGVGVTGLGRIARYSFSTNSYSSLGDGGLDGPVNSLYYDGQRGLCIGGNFGSLADNPVTFGRIVSYTEQAGWAGFENGLSGNRVNAIGRIMNNDGQYGDNPILVGGDFDGPCADAFCSSTYAAITDFIGYKVDDNIRAARAVGATNWVPAGNNNSKALNERVNALAADANGIVYVGGSFTGTQDGTTTLNRIARYDPSTDTWSPLANGGLNSVVAGMAVHGDNLYVVGIFSQTADGAVTNLNRIARYNLTTNTWLPVTGNGVNNDVYDMVVAGDNLYVGGFFTATHNGATTGLNGIGRYNVNTNTWSPLANNGVNGVVIGTALHGDNLYLGGVFSGTSTGGIFINNIARYNTLTNTWSALPNNGLNSFVGAMTVVDNDLWVNGNFSRTGDNTIVLDNLAMYSTGGDHWMPVTADAEFLAAAKLTSASVRVGNDRYVGGSFTHFNNGVARYFTRIYLQQWKMMAGTTDWHTATNWTTESVPLAGTNAVIPVGSGQMAITSADVTLRDLMHNGGTLTVGAGRTLTINGILGLNGGIIDGDGTVVITNCQHEGILRTRETSYIQARLVRCVNNTDSFNFPVGTPNGYSPVTIKNVTGTGNVSVKANQGAYSEPAMSLPANRLARWWQIENPGGGVTNSDIYFNYLESDIAGNEPGYRAYRISAGTASVISGTANTFSNVVTAPSVTGFSDWTLAEFAPSAASVSIGGRVLTANGNGINKAVVTLSDQNGNVRSVITSSFGYYRFDVEAGQSYVLTVGSKRYLFANPSRVISVKDDALDIDFVASP